MKSFLPPFNSRIYADAAAATPLSRSARAELERLLGLFANPGALHREAVAAKRELEKARARVAEAIGAHADEIVFVSGGTEANNLALAGVLRPILSKFGEASAITSAIEHSSILEPLAAMEEEGLYTMALGVDAQGLVSVPALREILNEQTALVSVQMVNSEIGTVQDIRAIAKEMRRARTQRKENGPNQPLPLLLHTDASQAPLWLQIKVDSLGVDLMTLDGQKICGPKGVGVLYVRRGTALQPLIYGGGQERGLRSGTENAAMAAAFAVALEEAQRDVGERGQRIAGVRDYLIDEIKKHIPDAVLNGATGASRAANNIHISVPGLDGDMAVLALDARGVAVSTRSACDSDEAHPSHVLEAIGVPLDLAGESLRITLLPSATRAQARRIALTLAQVRAGYGIMKK